MPDVSPLAPCGMVTLRADLADPRVAAAVGELPDPLRIVGGWGRGAAWMAPDELLLFCDDAPALAARLGEALEGAHHLALDVSDLRAGIAIETPHWRDVLAKLTPADVHPDALGPGTFRRSRLGQLAAAFWPEGQGARVLVMRSVADYALALLARSAADGPVGLYSAAARPETASP